MTTQTKRSDLKAKLKAYSATAGAILAVGYAGHAHVADAQGPIDHTDVDPDVSLIATYSLRNDTTISFGGGGPQFNLSALYVSSPVYRFYLQIPMSASASILGTGDPIPIPAGYTISSGNPNWSTVGGIFAAGTYSGSTFTRGAVTEGGDQYLGVKFQISGQTHYGWILITPDKTNGGISVVLKDYAYNTCPGNPIQAGQTTGTASCSAVAVGGVAEHIDVSELATLSPESLVDWQSMAVGSVGALSLVVGAALFWKREENS